jgi:hypothetical protein
MRLDDTEGEQRCGDAAEQAHAHIKELELIQPAGNVDLGLAVYDAVGLVLGCVV